MTTTVEAHRRYTPEQVSELEALFALDALDRSQFEELARLANVSGELPPPDFTDQGREMFTRETIQKWGKSAIQHRSSATLERVQQGNHLHVRASSWNAKTRSFEAIFASDTPAVVADMQSLQLVEEILLAQGGKFPARFPVLDTHQKTTTNSVVGTASNVRREGTIWIGKVTLADDPLAESIGRKVRDGHLDSMSIGYSIHDFKLISPGRSQVIDGREFRNDGERELRVVTSWSVREVSVVAFPADPTAKIRSQQRSAATFAIHSRESLTHIPHVGELVSAALLRCGISDPSQSRVRISRGGEYERFAHSSQALQDAERGSAYAELTVTELFARAAKLDGISLRDGMEGLWHASSTGARMGNLEEFFNSTFATVFTSTWDATGDITLGWVAESDKPNLLIQRNLRLSGATMKRRARGGTAEGMEFSSNEETSQLLGYAGMVTLDETEIADGAMGDFLTNFPKQMAAAARALRPNLIYSYLARNPQMSDGTALFHADHGNLKTSAGLNSANLAAARAAISSQEENSVKLNLRGQYLVVPQAEEANACKLARELELAGEGSVRAPIVRSDSRLDNGLTDPLTEEVHTGSDSDWFVSTAGQHALEVQYLIGRNRMPEIRQHFLSQGEFGVCFDVSHYMAVVAVDHRGISKNVA